MDNEIFHRTMCEVIEHLKIGRIEMAADIFDDLMVRAGAAQKHEICHNGPEDLTPMLTYIGWEQTSFAQIVQGWEDPDRAIAEALKLTFASQEGPPAIISLISDIVMSHERPEDVGCEDIEEMVAKGVGGATHAIGITTVHPYEGGHRVISLSRPYTFGEGEVQIGDVVHQTDTMMVPGMLAEVGTQTVQAIVDFMTKHPYQPKEEQDDSGTTDQDQ